MVITMCIWTVYFNMNISKDLNFGLIFFFILLLTDNEIAFILSLLPDFQMYKYFQELIKFIKVKKKSDFIFREKSSKQTGFLN